MNLIEIKKHKIRCILKDGDDNTCHVHGHVLIDVYDDSDMSKDSYGPCIMKFIDRESLDLEIKYRDFPSIAPTLQTCAVIERDVLLTVAEEVEATLRPD